MKQIVVAQVILFGFALFSSKLATGATWTIETAPNPSGYPATLTHLSGTGADLIPYGILTLSGQTAQATVMTIPGPLVQAVVHGTDTVFGGYSRSLLSYDITANAPSGLNVPIIFTAAWTSNIGSYSYGSGAISLIVSAVGGVPSSFQATANFASTAYPSSITSQYSLALANSFSSASLDLTGDPSGGPSIGLAPVTLHADGPTPGSNGISWIAGYAPQLSQVTDSFVGQIGGTFQLVGTGLHVDMLVETSAIGSFQTSLDPYFTIDPVFLAAHPDAYLAIQDYVGNASPVPEPSSTILIFIGLGLFSSVFISRRLAANPS